VIKASELSHSLTHSLTHMSSNDHINVLSLMDTCQTSECSGSGAHSEERSEEEVLAIYSFLTYHKPKLLEASLEVLDKQDHHRVTQVVSQSTGRSFHLVKGTSSSSQSHTHSHTHTHTNTHTQTYLVLSNYCPCKSFTQLFSTSPRDVSMNNQGIDLMCMCKHLFAVKLATSLGRIDKQTVSDEKFMEIFKSMEQDVG
jgi:predicted nucleic acid-binding Zn finger protein